MPLDQLNRPKGITCLKFVSLPRSKKPRCQHYREGGSCAIENEFMCVEWVKRNRQKGGVAEGYVLASDCEPVAKQQVSMASKNDRSDEEAPTKTEQLTEKTSDPLALDDVDDQTALPGIAASPRAPERPPPPRAAARRAPPNSPLIGMPEHGIGSAEDPITSEDVAHLADLNFEMVVDGWGDQILHLVPALTEACNERIEMTYRDAATLANTLAAFPGAHVTRVSRMPPKDGNVK